MEKFRKVTSVNELEYWTKTGTVIDGQNSSTTRVHGGGGQNNTAVHISSTTTKHLHLFVRQDDGKEFDASFNNSNVAVRAGHRVSVVYVGAKVDDWGRPAALVVHDTDRTAVFPARVEMFISRIEAWAGFLMVVGIALVAGLLFAGLVHSELFVLGFGIGLIGAVILMALRKTKNDALAAEVVRALNAKVREAIEQEKKRAQAA